MQWNGCTGRQCDMHVLGHHTDAALRTRVPPIPELLINYSLQAKNSADSVFQLCETNFVPEFVKNYLQHRAHKSRIAAFMSKYHCFSFPVSKKNKTNKKRHVIYHLHKYIHNGPVSKRINSLKLFRDMTLRSIYCHNPVKTNESQADWMYNQHAQYVAQTKATKLF